MARAAIVATGAVGAVALVVSCSGVEDRKLSGGGGGGGFSGFSGSGGTGGAAQCGVAWDPADPPCEGCAQQNCCSQLQACGAGTPCNAYVTCALANCTGNMTSECIQLNCAEQARTGGPTYIQLVDCVCTAMCPGLCSASCVS